MSKARGPYRVDPLGHKKSQQALDKKAENARELGLDYKPAKYSDIVSDGGLDPRNKFDKPAQQGLSDLDVWKVRALQAEAVIAKFMAEQPEQQRPVATLWQHGETGRIRITMPDDITDCDARWFKAADLYTSPPQRTWVGLTDEEIEKEWVKMCGSQSWARHKVYARNIESAIRSKNENNY